MVLEDFPEEVQKKVRADYGRIGEGYGVAAERFFEKAPGILGKLDEKYRMVVLGDVGRIAEKDGWVAYEFFRASPELAGKINREEVDGDFLLIEFIRDQKDAQIISQLIDMGKYKQMYLEKVQRFY